ncbi:hypothetical protein LTS17_006515 [Exophiala oligosperma]
MGTAKQKTPSPRHLTRFYIDGQYAKPISEQTYVLHNPKDDTVVADAVPIGGPEDVNAAVAAAEAAFRGPWSTFTAAQRSECLRRLADILEDRLVDILTLDSLTTGNPVSLIPSREKTYIKNNLLYYSGWTDKQKGDYYPADDGFVKLVRHEPLGSAPVADIKNTDDMYGIKVSFTGSVATGKKIQIAAAESNLKRVTLELGGKSPAVIFEDANIENALTWTINGILARSGQVCVAASRVYVQQTISQQFIDAYSERMKEAASRLGDPQDFETTLGPLADASSFAKVEAMIEKGKIEADLVVGGVRHGDSGCFMEPAVFLNPRPDAEIYKNEVFGPVAVIKTFETEEEVVKLANDTEFGLMAGVFTRDITRALRVSSNIDSGMNIQAPFGGKKISGIGREFGEYALRSFTEPKTVLIK